jgi:hypothetical protein
MLLLAAARGTENVVSYCTSAFCQVREVCQIINKNKLSWGGVTMAISGL